MIGHAAAAEWLRTLPWWDWRGWSDWFYGGQAIGVNYPPLGHAWMRFTHPVHGQMAAVAIGLLVLLPWGALRLARAVGYSPRGQRAAVAGVLVLTALSGNMHWVLSGFHSHGTFFGSWPAMVATVLGLHIAAWSARCQRPVLCGMVAGIAVLFNATVTPGIAVACAALLATSGASLGQGLRWAATASSAALAVCAWWLVPFLAGWDRLVRWEVPLHSAWNAGGAWQAGILAVVGTAAAFAARVAERPAQRLAVAALVGLLATLVADFFGYLRAERWLALAVFLGAMAAIGAVGALTRPKALQPVRPAWAMLAATFLIVLVVLTLRLELLPLVVWLLLWPRRTWVWGGALAWAAVLLWVPLVTQLRNPVPGDSDSPSPLEAVSEFGGPDAQGLVDLESLFSDAAGDVRDCSWRYPWATTAATSGRIRPLFGLYQETSPSAEFLYAGSYLRLGFIQEYGLRPNWSDAWQEAGRPYLDSPTRAEALGARWYASCDGSGDIVVTELPEASVVGVTVAPHIEEQSWHRAAVKWWVSGPQNSSVLPVLWPRVGTDRGHAHSQPAGRVSLHSAQDKLTLVAERPGWAWVRVPWDPYWQAENGAPVLKGGPGHLIVWAEQGTTEMHWRVPEAVDGAAATASGAGLLVTAALAIVNRRRGFPISPDRPRPVSDAVGLFVDTVDGWAHAFVRRIRRRMIRSD
ncbi:MAG: hypothetical protein F4231_04105 [Acidimicrobiaceae bacterium]|nr:hypothetical protein [Acidimicrobiaceae bacterium]